MFVISLVAFQEAPDYVYSEDTSFSLAQLSDIDVFQDSAQW